MSGSTLRIFVINKKYNTLKLGEGSISLIKNIYDSTGKKYQKTCHLTIGPWPQHLNQKGKTNFLVLNKPIVFGLKLLVSKLLIIFLRLHLHQLLNSLTKIYASKPSMEYKQSQRFGCIKSNNKLDNFGNWKSWRINKH